MHPLKLKQNILLFHPYLLRKYGKVKYQSSLLTIFVQLIFLYHYIIHKAVIATQYVMKKIIVWINSVSFS